MRLPGWLSRHLAAFRALLVFTVLLGLAYPLVMVGIARLPGLSGHGDGSLVRRDGTVIGSRMIGQSFTDADGNPLKQYVQPRPSAAGDGYDPTSTSASNLGPEDVVDVLPDPRAAPGSERAAGRPSLLSQVCARSKAVGDLEGLDGSRPYCTGNGAGAVLGVFHSAGLTGRVTRVVSLNETSGTPFLARYHGVAVELAKPGGDYSKAVITPIRGSAPAEPAVPADAVTASGSGLDPHISPAYARLQAPRVARERGIAAGEVVKLIEKHTTGRWLGFMGEPGVNVLELNSELDQRYPYRT